jgi:hypothetical protein
MEEALPFWILQIRNNPRDYTVHLVHFCIAGPNYRINSYIVLCEITERRKFVPIYERILKAQRRDLHEHQLKWKVKVR